MTTVVDPYSVKALSPDGRIGFADVIYPFRRRTWRSPRAGAGGVRRAGRACRHGGRVQRRDRHRGDEELEGAALIIAFIVLAIALVSLLAAALPVITAILGVGIGMVGITALTGVMTISETAPILATMLGLAVGIDYALFILSRHRQNLDDGSSREAAAQATATAGSAVVFAGLTVVIALTGLIVMNIPFLTVMGLAAAGTVSIAVLIAITLLPAAIGFAGDRLGRSNRLLAFRPRRRRSETDRVPRASAGHSS